MVYQLREKGEGQNLSAMLGPAREAFNIDLSFYWSNFFLKKLYKRVYEMRMWPEIECLPIMHEATYYALGLNVNAVPNNEINNNNNTYMHKNMQPARKLFYLLS